MTIEKKYLVAALLPLLFLMGSIGCFNSEPDLETVVEDIRASVVRIEANDSSGSGVIIEVVSGNSALVLTNYHVLEESDFVEIVVNDSESYKGHLQGYDSDIDLAILSICCGEFNALGFADVSSIRPGGDVIAMGYPLGFSGEASVSRGIVSAIRSGGDFEAIQLDAPINPGNSGGPLLTTQGKILGINTFSIRDAEGLGFAISESTVQKILPHIKGKDVLANARTPTPAPTLLPTTLPTSTVRALATATPAPWRSATPITIPTPRPTPTPILRLRPTVSFQPTITHRPLPTNTPFTIPTSTPTVAPPTVARGYFTRGSSQDDVLLAQGTPEQINTYSATRKEIWYYGWSTITFSLPDGKVMEWNNADGNLKVLLNPQFTQSSTSGFFTRGSSQDDVLLAQGTPEQINTYSATRKEIWYYGWSTITFSLPDGKVMEWNNADGNLKVLLNPQFTQSSTSGFFTRGSSQDDVLLAQGTPEQINTYSATRKEIWYYGWSTITFSLPDGKVMEWNNADGNLRVR